MDETREVFVIHDQREISNFLIRKWKEICGESIRNKGYFTVALSGGKTPLFFYSDLAKLKRVLPWDKTHIFLVDERFVPLTDGDSNYRMIKETLLNKIDIPKDNIHHIHTVAASPDISAKKYENHMRVFFELKEKALPEFDLILLGIGEDGHTASLFPESKVLRDRIHLAAPVILDEHRHNRITLTLPVINRASNIIFLVTGKNKASVAKAVIEKKDPLLPASLVLPEKGELLFVLDGEAGSDLSGAKQ